MNEQKRFWYSVGFMMMFVVMMWVVFFLSEFAEVDFSGWANAPKSEAGLAGIVLSPLVHGSWEHILSNTLPFMILFTVLLNAYPAASMYVLLTVWLGSGLAVWWIGQEGTLHIGMSGVIYGLAFFLISSAIFIRHRVAVLIAVFVVVLYGSMAEGFLPKEGVSWQSHLAGALCGVISALVFGRLDRQYKTRDEEDERDVRFFEETGNSQWGGP